MEILTIVVTGVLCMACFFIGAKVSQTVLKGEDIKVPEVNPMKLYREHQGRKEAEREQNKLDTLMHNIEVYDGTSAGQQEIPN